jgi:hypothetical protein
MPETDNADLVEIACVQGPFEADLIKNLLESHGIASVVRGRTAPFVYPLTVDGMAEFKIFVQGTDVAKARDLLTAIPSPDGEDGSENPA